MVRYKTAFPDVPIKVYGPPTTSGTRASFAEMINQKAYCGKDSVAKKLSKARGDKKGKKCRAMRTDGAYVEAGEQDNLIVQKLKEDPTAYGIFGFSFKSELDSIQGGLWTMLRQHLKISLLASIRLRELFTFT